MKKHFLLALLINLFFGAYLLNSADLPAIRFGLSASFNRMMYYEDDPKLSQQDPSIPRISTSGGNGITFGGLIQLPLNTLTTKLIESRLRLKLCYTTSIFIQGELVGDVYPSLVDDGRGGYNSVQTEIHFYINRKHTFLSSDLTYSLKFSKLGITINAGPQINYSLYNNELRTITYFPDKFDIDSSIKIPVIIREIDSNTDVYKDEADPNLTGIALGLSCGIGYEFKIGSLTFSPNICYRHQKYFQNMMLSMDVLF